MLRKTPIIAFCVLLIGGLIVHLLGAWWWFAILAFLVGVALRPTYPSSLFGSGFFAGALVWLIGIFIYSSGESALPQQIAELFSLGSAFVLGIVLCIIGGITGGLFCVLGAYSRALIQPAAKVVAT